MIVIVAILLAGANILAVAIADVAVLLATSLAALWYCRRLLPGLQISRRCVRVSVLQAMLPYSAQVFVISLWDCSSCRRTAPSSR